MKPIRLKAIIIRIPSDTHRKFKTRCVLDCKTMQEVLEEFIKHLAHEKDGNV